MKQLILALLAVATTLAPSTGKPTAAVKAGSSRSTGSSSLTILYTASARGQVRSCNCTKFRFGGYGREVTLVKSIRQSTPNLVVVEGGDLLEWTGFQADHKSEVAAQALKMMSYAAMIPGEDELAKNAASHVERFGASVPLVAANYHKGGSSEPTYATHTITKTAGGLKVGIIGLLSPAVGRLFQEADFASSIRDPVEPLKSTLAQVRPKCDLVLLVYHGPLDEARKLASTKGVDVVLASHRTGKDVLFPDKNTESNEVTAPIEHSGDAFVANAETHMNWSVGRIDLQLTSARKVTSATHKLLYLDRRYDEDPEMVKVYDSYNTKVRDAVLSESDKFKKETGAMLAKRGLNLAEMRARLRKSPFVGSGKCKECHPEVHEIWSNSRHAKAMDTLKKRNQEFDPECISCHATGVMVRNGFRNMKDTPELANVQCEACHGPAEKHVAAPARGWGKSGEHTCRSCHTEERTPDFDFAQEWAKVMH